ncbi:MAG: hypothetical protein [Arizlama microvirus]|nr:MAG: hypothetical protein [Arizlama microvirus]
MELNVFDGILIGFFLGYCFGLLFVNYLLRNSEIKYVRNRKSS